MLLSFEFGAYNDAPVSTRLQREAKQVTLISLQQVVRAPHGNDLII